jgi:hydrogenase 3 maturation protease
MRGLVITVGNEMKGDDGAGPLLARLLSHSPLEAWEVIDAGTMPEDYIHRIRRLKPDLLVLVDAADMGLEPGSVRLLSEEEVAEQFILTTHNLPLSFFIHAVREIVHGIRFIGIQPGNISFGAPMTSAVRSAVVSVCEKIKAGQLDFEHI